MTTTVDLDSLEKAAKAATPGPWEQFTTLADDDLPESVIVGAGSYIESGGASYSSTDLILETDTYGLEEGEDLDTAVANATYVALANPQSILTLIAEVRALRAAAGTEG